MLNNHHRTGRAAPPLTEPQHIKLSEVAHTTGIPADTLKLMVTDDLLAWRRARPRRTHLLP